MDSHRAHKNICGHGREPQGERAKHGYVSADDHLPAAALGLLPGVLPAHVLPRR